MKGYRLYSMILIGLFSLSLLAVLYSIFIKKPQAAEPKSSVMGKSVRLPGSKVIGVIQIFSPITYSGESGGVLNTRRDGALYWLDLLKKAEQDDQIKVVVLRLNTPGGTIAATQEIYNQILRLRKKDKLVVVSMGDITASGGYYIASAADYVVANPGTLTGSIGVIMTGIDLSDLFQRFGIRYNVLKSGTYKDGLASYRKMTPEERELFQSVVMDAYWQFFNAVKEGRKLTDAELRKVADGRILTAQQAIKHKLVDELGDYQKTIEIAAEKAGLGKNYVVEDIVPDYRDMFTRYFNILYDRVFQAQAEYSLLPLSGSPLRNSYSPVLYMSTY